MSRRIDHDKVRAEADLKPKRTVVRDSKRDAVVISARSRPSVDEMVADVARARAREATSAAASTGRSVLDDLDEDEGATC